MVTPPAPHTPVTPPAPCTAGPRAATGHSIRRWHVLPMLVLSAALLQGPASHGSTQEWDAAQDRVGMAAAPANPY